MAVVLDLARPESWPIVLTAEQVVQVLACPGEAMKDRRRHLHDRYVHRGVLVPIGGVPETKRLSQSLRYSRSDVWRLIGYTPTPATTPQFTTSARSTVELSTGGVDREIGRAS